jgi:thiamine-phosphate pyrophosphorylase
MPWLADAILQRDTPGDIGTEIKTPAERVRQDLAAVVTAAGKRFGEALRVIEECLKTADPSAAGRVERLRYQGYTIEQRLAQTLRPGGLFASVRLYVLITESICRRPWLAAAEEAIAGGADCLQLREKNLDGGEFLRRARQLVELCRSRKVLCIINDRVDIAALSKADGVHLGQEDVPATAARQILGAARIIGVSTHRIEQARQARLDGADYIGVGPVFPSPTKPREFVAGLGYARQAAESVEIPAVAIAGIDLSNVDDVWATGVSAIAVTAAVVGCDDIRQAARNLKSRLVGPRPVKAEAKAAVPV